MSASGSGGVRRILGMSVALFCVVMVVVTVGVIGVVGVWKLHWFLANSTVNHQTSIIQHSNSRQNSLVTDLTSKLGTIDGIQAQIKGADGPVSQSQIQTLVAQERGVAREACQDAAEIDQQTVTLGQGVPAWIKTNCLAGSLSPDSPLENPGG